MAGAWEIRAQKQILIEILFAGPVTLAWALGLRRLQVPGHIMPITGMPYDHARNTGAQACLEHGFEWLGCLDSDVIPEPDAFLRLMSHKLPICSGLYARRSPPHGIPVIQKGGGWITEIPRKGGLIEVDVCGAGLLVIHRSVLETMAKNPEPKRPGKNWFDWRVDLRNCGVFPDKECMSEDFVLNNRCRDQLGIRTWCDVGCVARHVGDFEVTPGNVQPLNTF